MNENKMFNQLTAITRFACNYYNQGYCQPSKQTCFAACPRCTLHDRSQRCNHLLYQ